MNTPMRLRRIGDCIQFFDLSIALRAICDRNVVAQVKKQRQCSGDEKQKWPGRLHLFLLSSSLRDFDLSSRASGGQPKDITEPNPASTGLKGRRENVFARLEIGERFDGHDVRRHCL
jgi:hypothetical protein